MRSLIYETAASMDFAAVSTEEDERRRMAARSALMTPIAKAWCTDEGVRLCSVAVQIHGGAGYIEDAGIAQRYRDSRIAPIYEGTNGIQAIDLIERKVHRDGGVTMRELVADLAREAGSVVDRNESEIDRGAVMHALDTLGAATQWIVESDVEDHLAAAHSYLELAAISEWSATCSTPTSSRSSTDKHTVQDFKAPHAVARLRKISRTAHSTGDFATDADWDHVCEEMQQRAQWLTAAGWKHIGTDSDHSWEYGNSLFWDLERDDVVIQLEFYDHGQLVAYPVSERAQDDDLVEPYFSIHRSTAQSSREAFDAQGWL